MTDDKLKDVVMAGKKQSPVKVQNGSSREDSIIKEVLDSNK